MATTLLSPDEYKEFQKAAKIKRSVKLSRPGDHELLTLDQLVLRTIGNVVQSATFKLNRHLLLINGYQEDGISWACQQIAEAVAQKYPTWKVKLLTGRTKPNEIPEIVKDIGINSAYRICRRLELIPHSYGFAWLTPIVFLVSATVLTLLVLLLDKFVIEDHSFQGWYQWSAYGAGALISCLSAYLVNQIPGMSNQNLVNSLSTLFSNDIRRLSPGQQELLREVARVYIKLAVPGCVIVDDFARLDSFTQETIVTALSDADIHVRASLVWVVTETHDYPLLSRRFAVDASLQNALRGHHSSCTIEPADETQRRELAKGHGLPEEHAVDHLFLKSLCRPSTDNETRELAQRWKDTLRVEKSRRIDIEEIVQLLVSNSRYPEFALDWNESISLFTTESGLFKDLIREGKLPLNRAEVREVLTEFTRQLRSLFIHPGAAQEKIVFKPQTYEAIATPDSTKQARFHLFWLLHWSRRQQNRTPSVPFERMLLTHILKISTLTPILRGPKGVELVEEYISSLSRASADCFHLTLMKEGLQIANELLRALDALGEFQLEDEQRQWRVWRIALIACWRAHIVTRSDEILKSLFEQLSLLAIRKNIVPIQDSTIDDALCYLALLGITEEKGRLALAAKKRLGGSDQVVYDKVILFLKMAWAEVLYLLTETFSPPLLRECGMTPYNDTASSLLQAIPREMYDEKTIHAQQEFVILNHELSNLFNYTHVRLGICSDPTELYLNIMAFENLPQSTNDHTEHPLEYDTLLEKALKLESLAGSVANFR